MKKSDIFGTEKQNIQERDQCIWMQAGVVRKKYCERDYRCIECVFEKALRRAIQERRGGIVAWQDKLRELPQWKRPCVHHMRGIIEYRSCTNDYNCNYCEFDQYMQDQYTVHAVISPVSSFEVGGFKIPQGYYFHEGHAWAKVEESPSVRIGIDDFIRKVLGPFDRIECPLLGKQVEQGKEAIRIIRGDKQAQMLSPITGVVTSINPALMEQGKLANDDPYVEGWIMTVHSPDLRKDLKKLSINEETREFMGKEVNRLFEVIEQVEGPLSTDGGTLGNDIFGIMPKLGWERLCQLFLRT